MRLETERLLLRKPEAGDRDGYAEIWGNEEVVRFLGAVYATVVRASRWPNTGEPVLRDDNDEIIERKVPADGFPYAVRYRILGDRLLVMAVLHQSRHPNFGDDRQP